MSNVDIREFRAALDGRFVLLLTSNEIEKKAVAGRVEKYTSATIGMETKGCGVGKFGPFTILHVNGVSGVTSDQSIGKIYQRIRGSDLLPKPCAVLLVGFCWGNPALVHAGDTIICSELHCLNRLEASDQRTRTPAIVRSAWTLSSNRMNLLRKDLPSVRLGTLCSLEAKVTSASERDGLIASAPGILGGEMEGFGIVSPGGNWLIVKTVSDFGDEQYTKESQRASANQAADIALRVVGDCFTEVYVKPNDSDNTEMTLFNDLLGGQFLHVTSRGVHPDMLNDYLNDEIGAPLELRASRYAAPSAYSTEVVRQLVDAVLEIVQNAIRHGKADRASIATHPSKISIEFDGVAFDVLSISGENGGSLAIRQLLNCINDDKSIKLEQRSAGDKHSVVISLSKAGEMLRKAKLDCEVVIKGGEIGRPQGTPSPIHYKTGCETLYVDARKFRMMSRRMSVMKALETPLKAGTKVLIACSDNSEVSLYRTFAAKSEFGDLITIFLA